MRNAIVIFFVVLALTGQSQSQFALSLSNTLISDTAYMGSILGYSMEIENSGTDTICWPIQIFVNVNSSYWELNGVILFDSLCFAPGDVILIDWPITDTTNSLILGGYIDVTEERSFVSGDNVIVVWPAITDSTFASHGYALESEQFINIVYVVNPSAIGEQEKQPIGLSIDNNTLIVDAPKLKHYELYDIMGRSVMKGSRSTIDCNGLKSGMYMLYVILHNGQHYTLKVILP